MRIVVDGLPYPVIASDDGPREIARIAAASEHRAIVVSDLNVQSRGDVIARSLEEGGHAVALAVAIPAGERRKHWKAVSDLHAAWAAAGADRHTLVIAVGGGTLTDVAGFAAATFMRGLPWLAVPTTVLGMVDAAIGGKTGVDRPEGKNLIGSIWQPAGVVLDLVALETLAVAQRKTGMAEIVKAAVVGDPSLLDAAEGFDVASAPQQWAGLLAQAAAVKAKVVAKDPLDLGGRAVLNLGHTFAHAIEHASRYRVTHGAAVALGLRAAGVLARDRTGWPKAHHHRMLHALRRAGLRVVTRGLSLDDIISAMRHDKKRVDGVPRFVLPVRLGEVRPGVFVPEDEVRGALSALEAPVESAGW